MIKKIAAALITLFIASAGYAAYYAWGGYAGYIPSMGGSLGSKIQEDLGDTRGIYGINRTQSGKDTVKIDRLFGACLGAEFKALFGDYFIVRSALNFAMNVLGGEGKTLDLSGNIVKAKYSMWQIDLPLAAGIYLPFQKDAIVYICGGAAFAYGSYSNSFKSSSLSSSSTFAGFASPLVFILGGEYFVSERITILAQISYYKGSSGVIRDGKDCAPVDFGGYRFFAGASYYTEFKVAVKKPEDSSQ